MRRTLKTILEVNRIKIPYPVPVNLKEVVLFEKLYHIHDSEYDGRSCGSCRSLLYDGKCCSQCKIYHYCNRECQRRHWKAHKPYCSMIRERNDAKDQTGLEHVRSIPGMLEHFEADVLSNQWDGKENTVFEDYIKAIQFIIDKHPGRAAMAFQLMPNVTQTHGPDTFLKLFGFALERCNTPFVHEQKAWLGCLASFLNPWWPKANDTAEPKRILHPNAKVFLNATTMVDELFSILLTSNNKTLPDCCVVMNYLAFYEGAGMVEPELPAGVETDVDADPLFGNLPVHLHFDVSKFLAPVDLMQFGRCCKSAAALVTHSVLKTAIWYCRKTSFLASFLVRYENVLQEAEEKYMEHLRQVADADDGEESVEARSSLNSAFRSVDIIMKKVLSTFCFLLRTMMLLRRPGSPVCPFMKILVFRIAADQVTFRKEWLEPLDRLMPSHHVAV
jgi:hypothetical protein